MTRGVHVDVLVDTQVFGGRAPQPTAGEHLGSATRRRRGADVDDDVDVDAFSR